jgi:hypothetical protein
MKTYSDEHVSVDTVSLLQAQIDSLVKQRTVNDGNYVIDKNLTRDTLASLKFLVYVLAGFVLIDTAIIGVLVEIFYKAGAF